MATPTQTPTRAIYIYTQTHSWIFLKGKSLQILLGRTQMFPLLHVTARQWKQGALFLLLGGNYRKCLDNYDTIRKNVLRV